jgi:hypothetical protein
MGIGGKGGENAVAIANWVARYIKRGQTQSLTSVHVASSETAIYTTRKNEVSGGIFQPTERYQVC